MTTRNFSIFDTALGACGIVWTERGVAGVQVHDGSEHATRARMLRRFPGAQEAPPPVDVQHAIDGIVALLRGEQRDLNDVSIDADDLPAFNRKVYDITRAIPPGATLTYGEIAERLGDKLLARDVGSGAWAKSDPVDRPLSSRAGCQRQDRWFLGSRRCRQQAPAAHNRRRAAQRADALRSFTFGRETPPALVTPASTPPPP